MVVTKEENVSKLWGELDFERYPVIYEKLTDGRADYVVVEAAERFGCTAAGLHESQVHDVTYILPSPDELSMKVHANLKNAGVIKDVKRRF